MEKIIQVDLFDRPIGELSKVEAHHSALLHRAFSVFVYADGKMLIQQRALHKYHSGGLWANACCSHPRVGEQLKEAVQRRLVDELGIHTTSAEEIFSFVYYHKFQDCLYEYEFDHVFLLHYQGEVNPNLEEIERVAWVGYHELAEDLLQNPHKYAPWFTIAAPRVLAHLSLKKNP